MRYRLGVYVTHPKRLSWGPGKILDIKGSIVTVYFRDSLDNVAGMLHLKSLVQSGSLEDLHIEALEKLIEPPYFVPEGASLNSQLVHFQRARQRTALVVDESRLAFAAAQAGADSATYH